MKTRSLWMKVPVLVFFFGAIICFVAYRVGAFDNNLQVRNNLSANNQPDSPKVQFAQPSLIESTKSGRVIGPANNDINNITKPDSQRQKMIISGSKSLLPPNGKPAPDSQKRFIIPSSKMMVLPERKIVPDSTKKTAPAPPPPAPAQKKANKKAKQKKQVSPKNNNPSNKNTEVIIPSSKSGPVFAPNE